MGSRSSYDSSSSFGNFLFCSFVGDLYWSCCWYYYYCFSIFLGTDSYSILAYSIIKFLDKRFWIFRICIIKWSIRVPWQCYHWSNLEDGWRNQIFSFQYRLHSTLNYNINYTLINTPSLPASSHTRFGSICNHGHNSRFVEFFKLTFAGI